MWITLTIDDVATVCLPAELAAHRRFARQSDGSDPVLATINEVVTLVRGHVGGCRRNLLGPDGTIPEELKNAALAIISSLIPAGSAPDAAKKANAERAQALLDKVSECKFAIVNPPTASVDANQPSGGNIAIARQGGDRRVSRESLEGL